jgi:hypothetical protein
VTPDLTSSGEIKESKSVTGQTSTRRLDLLNMSKPELARLPPQCNSLLFKAYHEVGPMRLGKRFSFALQGDDVRACLSDRLRWNNRLEFVF